MHKPVAQVQYFRSKIDGRLAPCVVCATDDADEPKPLLLEVSPGASAGNLGASVKLVESIAAIAAGRGHSCVVLRPTGRGPGSIYQNYGEVDLFEAVEHVCSVHSIDRDRISVTGSSMGGAATWYLASHYPDVFAAAAPFCGYCDWRLWEKPGGLTYHMHPWEQVSWESRCAAFMVENLRHTPVWMTHGQWDRSVGGGVPAEHSIQMARRMEEAGFDHKLTIVPKTGHGCRTEGHWEDVVDWMLSQTKARSPRHVSLASYGLRHNRSYWLAVEQLQAYDRRGLAEAVVKDGSVIVTATNVATVSLGDVPGGPEAAVTIDGTDLGRVRLAGWTSFARAGGVWRRADGPPAGSKRPGASGPVGDMFFEPLTLVPGTTGSEAETFFNAWVARHAVGYFSSRNGGAHRGGIMGADSVALEVIKDADLTDDDLAGRNLLLYGTPASNAVFKRLGGDLPIAFSPAGLELAGKTYAAERAAALAVFPHPLREQGYVGVHGGLTADAITWGSHLDMMLLPDYIVYAGGELLDHGFFDNDWKA